jgi:hypothetical protein
MNRDEWPYDTPPGELPHLPPWVVAPDEFFKAVELERLLNRRRDELGRDHVYFTRFGRPLDDVIPDGVEVLPFADDDEDEHCDGGVCFT